MRVILEGVRLNGPGDGRETPHRQGSPLTVTYRALQPEAAALAQEENKPSREARRELRHRVRLRSGKILDRANNYVCDVRLHDLSAKGLRLALPADIALPRRFCVFDDDFSVVRVVQMAWRRGATIGARYCDGGLPRRLKPSDRFALRNRYYAVPDR